MSHTPGPWTVYKQFNVMAERRQVAATGGHQDNMNQEKVYEENVANARLIAAAPDLLENGDAAADMLYAQYMEYALKDPNRDEQTIDLMMQVYGEWKKTAARARGEA